MLRSTGRNVKLGRKEEWRRIALTFSLLSTPAKDVMFSPCLFFEDGFWSRIDPNNLWCGSG